MEKLKYSYDTFKNPDFNLNEILDKESIDEIDNVDITNVDHKQDLFKKYTNQLMNEMIHSTDLPRHWMFKDCVLIDKMDKNISLYYFFSISDWNRNDKEVGIDSRTLTMSIYTYYNPYDESYDGIDLPDRRFAHEVTYRIKLEHSFQMYINFDGYLRYKINRIYTIDDINRDSINLFIEPVYINREDSKKFVRISDYYYGKRHDKVQDLRLDFIHIRDALARFLFLQQFAYYNINNSKSLSIKTKSMSKPKKIDNIRKYSKNTISNKFITINIDNVLISIKPKRRNIYIDKECKNIGPMHQYRYQVVGHERKQWKGSKKNNTWHQETIWIDSYYRCNNEEFSITKNYTNKEV
jgi:hypothetical protein